MSPTKSPRKSGAPAGKPVARRPRLARVGRRALTLVKVLVGLALVLGTAGATAFGGYRLALGSSHFELRRLEVATSQRLGDWAVARRAGISRGDNLLALDLRAAEKQLLSDPWVGSVRLTRQLPDGLRIELSEHEALALTSLDGQLYLVDAQGEPFKRWEADDPYDLPMLTGVTGPDLAKDRGSAIARLATGLAVLAHYERLPVSRVQTAQEVNLAPDGSVVLTVGVHGVALHLGEGPWPRKLLMVSKVFETFEKKRQLPGVVFLDNALHPERVVVRMR